MKQTFTNKYFNWLIILFTAVTLIDSSFYLFTKFEYYSTYFLHIAFAICSIVAFLSLFIRKANSEKYSKLIIIIRSIVPGLVVFNEFITDLIFYGVNRYYLLLNPFLILNLVLGIALVRLTKKYSMRVQSEQKKDYGVLIGYVGLYLILLCIVVVIESQFNKNLNSTSIWEINTKIIVSMLIIYLGYLLRNENSKFKLHIFFSLILMSIYGLL